MDWVGELDFTGQVTLGQTDLICGRLGISSSFGAPAKAYEMAFERGCNYFTWGTFIRGRSGEMKQAIRNIKEKGQRDQLVLAMFTYAHQSLITEYFYNKGLKALGLDYADILLLGYYPGMPSRKMMDKALILKEKGLVRFIGLSSHNRQVFPRLHEKELMDVYHIRYNAAHRGAETDCFPQLDGEKKPGIVSFTATRWGNLLNPRKMPRDELPLRATDCYRFVLSHPAVDICMMGAKNMDEMRENLSVLELGPLSENELKRVRRIGDFVHG